MSSFLIFIVFMKILIAIIAQSFKEVNNNRNQNLVLGQLKIINEFNWLVDLNEKFADKKYIVYVSPNKL